MPSPSPADYNYLLRLLSMLIDRAGGELRIDAAELHNSEPPKGFLKRWDNEKRQLVIESVSHGTALYLVNSEDSKWTPSSPPLEPLESKQQLTGTDLLQTSQPAQPAQPAPVLPFRPSTAQVGSPTPSRVVLDDPERQERLETERAKQAALKQIIEYSSPEPSSQSPRMRRSPNYSTQPPSQPPAETPPPYFKP